VIYNFDETLINFHGKAQDKEEEEVNPHLGVTEGIRVATTESVK
jgi:hypothetical protein